jgi:hypothetical protein
MSTNPNSNQHVFEMQEPTSQNGPADAEENNPDSPGNDDLQPQREPTRANITNVLLTRTSRWRRTFKEITDSAEEVDVLEANGSVKSIVDWARKAKLDERQRRAFEIITGTFVLTFFQSEQDPESVGHGFWFSDREYLQQKLKLKRLVEDDRLKTGEQLICFLHGPGGSGKSTVIDLITEYARDYCSYMEDYQFTSCTIVVTAMSGVAATLSMGEMTHGAVYLNQKTDIKAEQVDAWQDTRLLIVDEISFATKKQIIKLHKNLTRLKQKIYSRFGGLNVMFAGDLRQMEPPGQYDKPLYEDECLEFEEWINCFIELKGMHQFKDDPEWGKLLQRFRDGMATLADIDMINERVVKMFTELPDDIKYVTYFNKDRNAINAALFQEWCETLYNEIGTIADSIMIYSNEIEVQNGSGTYMPFKNCKIFWEGCGEDNIKTREFQGRMDPVLRLYRSCRLMLPINMNVSKGQANGSQVTLEKMVLKEGVVPQEVLLDGVPVKASVQVKWTILC